MKRIEVTVPGQEIEMTNQEDNDAREILLRKKELNIFFVEKKFYNLVEEIT
jgi:hypothetical protein